MHVTASRPVGNPAEPLLLDFAGLGNGSARVRFDDEPAIASYLPGTGERIEDGRLRTEGQRFGNGGDHDDNDR